MSFRKDVIIGERGCIVI